MGLYNFTCNVKADTQASLVNMHNKIEAIQTPAEATISYNSCRN